MNGMLEQVELTEHRDEILGYRFEGRVVGLDGLKIHHCCFDL